MKKVQNVPISPSWANAQCMEVELPLLEKEKFSGNTAFAYPGLHWTIVPPKKFGRVPKPYKIKVIYVRVPPSGSTKTNKLSSRWFYVEAKIIASPTGTFRPYLLSASKPRIKSD